MMHSLDTRSSSPALFPWPCLESARGLLSVPACWRERLGDHYETFRRAFLSRSSLPAKYYPCPRHCGCMHEIIQEPAESIQSSEGVEGIRNAEHTASVPTLQRSKTPLLQHSNTPPSSPSTPDTRHFPLVAICTCPTPHCPDILVPADEAILLELSWTKLARALCAALHLDYKPLDLGLLNTRQIGSWSSDSVPVILTIQTDHSWFRGVVLELVVRLRRKFILLAPTGRHFDAMSQEVIESADSGFFPLEGHLRFNPDGALESIETPGKLFARFNPKALPSEGEETARRAFALVEQLETDKPLDPSPMAVFRLYCVEGLSLADIARKLHSTRTTVLRRLELIEARTGVPPKQLRRFSAHLDKIEEETSDSRARRIHRKSLIERANDE